MTCGRISTNYNAPHPYQWPVGRSRSRSRGAAAENAEVTGSVGQANHTTPHPSTPHVYLVFKYPAHYMELEGPSGFSEVYAFPCPRTRKKTAIAGRSQSPPHIPDPTEWGWQNRSRKPQRSRRAWGGETPREDETSEARPSPPMSTAHSTPTSLPRPLLSGCVLEVYVIINQLPARC